MNDDAAADVPKYAAWTTSRPSPAIRESPVAKAKIAVLTAIRRRGGLVAPGPSGGAPGPSGGASGPSGGPGGRGGGRRVDDVGGVGGTPSSGVPVWVSISARAGYSRARCGEGSRSFPLLMANIKSQKKRILRAERERLENRRYTSKIKTYFHRLERAVQGGDETAVESEHRVLMQTIDKAVKRGAIHRNNGARKKARAARVRRGGA